MSIAEEVDLWAGEELPFELEQPESTVEVYTDEPLPSKLTTPNFDGRGLLTVEGRDVSIFLRGDLRSSATVSNDLNSLHGLEEVQQDGVWCYFLPLSPINAYVLRHVLKRVKGLALGPDAGPKLAEAANRIQEPRAYLADTGKHVEIAAPHIKVYQDILKKVSAYPVKSGFRVPIGKVLDLEALAANVESNLPSIVFTEEVLALTREPLPNFDGTVEGLKSVPIGALNVVGANLQQWKHLKSNDKSLEEKFEAFGIANLHDLLFTLPKRFIDKSNPQDFDGLMEGESVTIVGNLIKAEDLPNGMGVFFLIGDSEGRSIKTNFWRQQWLKTKFKPGDEVLLTGKISRFKGRLELGGSSIEHAEEAALLPIVPVYRQSDSKGVTTHLIMAATRELLARAGSIELPPYLRARGELTYTQALTELHFPTSLPDFKKACDTLAYYELVYMQLLMREEKAAAEEKKGIKMEGGPRDLQNKLVRTLPFKLTSAQVRGVKRLNELMSDSTPSQILLNADVGAGKSLVAQFACLRAVDAGRQAVIIGPTEILARQLYSTLMKLKEFLSGAGEELNVEFLGSGMKVREKKPILAGLKDGSINIVVGTTSVIAESVEYADLGLVVVDEQQKFGAEQRTRLLSRRPDGLAPDLLMMSATPIPRSTAQVFYGDMEMVELDEKPPGRLPIVTDWIEEDPIDFAHQLTNHVWSDVANEVAAGNQAFVITPMVQDSDKVDAASVERTYKALCEGALRGHKVGFVHGRMKKEDQTVAMEAFRSGETQVLVASTVVEVGVDIPDATRVVILSADRLGAASLHQIRGRVGRNSKPSRCYLVSMGKTLNSQVRLQALVDSENGFDIALSDLEVRGEGKMFSTEQSGGSEMIFASLARHKDWIEQAQKDAHTILASPHASQALADARTRFSSERLY